MAIPQSAIYKMDMSSPLNEPFYYYTYGGRGMHDGLSEGDRYVILMKVEGQDNYVFANISTGKLVVGVHPVSRFVAV